MLYEIARTPTVDTVIENSENIRRISDFLSTAELVLADEVASLVNKENRKQYIDWISSDHFKRDAALAMLCAVYMRMNEVTKEQAMRVVSESMIERYIESHTTALQFRCHFWSCFLDDGFDLKEKKRANSIWDEFIMGYAGRTIKGEPILLVTGEKNIHKAAEKVGCSEFFMTPDKYKECLYSE